MKKKKGGAVKKMQTGGVPKRNISKPGAGFAPETKGGSNLGMNIYGIPNAGQTGPNRKVTTETMQKGGSFAPNRAVQSSCKDGRVRDEKGRCVMSRKMQEGGSSKFGMLSVKAGVDKNPKPTQADRIAGAKMQKGGATYTDSYGYGKGIVKSKPTVGGGSKEKEVSYGYGYAGPSGAAVTKRKYDKEGVLKKEKSKDVTPAKVDKYYKKNENKIEYKIGGAAKPSTGLTKKKKSTVAKKASAGKDIGKKGKMFDKIAAKAGGGDKGKRIAAAAMWKNIRRG
jgi:hypothetical protein